jgi:hypothetical protein
VEKGKTLIETRPKETVAILFLALTAAAFATAADLRVPAVATRPFSEHRNLVKPNGRACVREADEVSVIVFRSGIRIY